MTRHCPPREIRVKIAEHGVGGGDTALTTVGLGSCVAIALHDAAAGIGALAHVLLPAQALARGTAHPAKCADSAVPLLLAEMRAAGAGPEITAKLVGGASMFVALLPRGGITMGDRNVQAALAALARAGVPVVARDTGGDYGRSLAFEVRTGRVVVRSLTGEPRVL